MAVVVVCPSCQHSSRTNRELRPAAKIRCPQCGGMFRCFIHGNGAVELRPGGPAPAPAGAGGPSAIPSGIPGIRRLPPRVGEPDGGKSGRTIFSVRRKNRPIGGYLPFEKSRSYLGMWAGISLAGAAAFAAYWYVGQIDRLGKAAGRTGDAWRGQDEALRKQFRARQQRALRALGAAGK